VVVVGELLVLTVDEAMDVVVNEVTDVVVDDVIGVVDDLLTDVVLEAVVGPTSSPITSGEPLSAATGMLPQAFSALSTIPVAAVHEPDE
jgi:hypothetical protein